MVKTNDVFGYLVSVAEESRSNGNNVRLWCYAKLRNSVDKWSGEFILATKEVNGFYNLLLCHGYHEELGVGTDKFEYVLINTADCDSIEFAFRK